ncbi:hypothetical protein [Maritimibacter fusiformis]|jgi:hypothetical protein|nr:hypothetical protein [Maritimibacter fusiformis]
MLTDIKQVLSRSTATIWQDIVGATSLVVVLLAALHLPGAF